MTSRNLLNLGLLFFIAVLIALLVYEPGKEKPVTPPLLTKLQASEITHLSIKIDNKELEFNKTEAGWMMLKPFRQPANPFRIDSILKLLSAVSLSQNNMATLQPKEFGLDHPAAIVSFNKDTAILFGNNNSLKHHRYVQINSDLHMIADTFYYQLAAKAESFIDHQLIPKDQKIIKLVLPGLTLAKNDASWSVKPMPTRFSMDAVNQLIDEWQLSQAYDIAYHKNKINSQAGTKSDITIDLSNNKTLRFTIEKSSDDFSLLNIDTGIQYILSKDRRDKPLKLPEPETADKP
ncbi:MAG: DUF4340 domain-containing protein [Gammaproteobacteria bacterium]|nr:DUF4340 domain-containing protein [Gammaproteobacteria bacterium]